MYEIEPQKLGRFLPDESDLSGIFHGAFLFSLGVGG